MNKYQLKHIYAKISIIIHETEVRSGADPTYKNNYNKRDIPERERE